MVKDGHIRLLPIHVANKIAAGEVVERPASVVKELLENALDAGATRIEITITAGGRKLIEVRDNGRGMIRDDALLCLERQATSKIRDVDDIESIDTLGFRGEALPSIASVSRFTLRTRHEDAESGVELVVNGGSLAEVHEAGMPVGTTIAVRDLFFNVPARRKFLRAYQTEQAHVRSVFTLHALAHPEVGFTLTADGREIERVPAGATLEERVLDLFGQEFHEGLRPIEHEECGIRVSGFAGLPHQGRRDRSEQYIFVNRRPATAPIIAYALREAYPPLEDNRKPIVLLFIDLAPERVDVNVHPTKREVRFQKAAEVREAIINGVGMALAGGGRGDIGGQEPGDGSQGPGDGSRGTGDGSQGPGAGGQGSEDGKREFEPYTPRGHFPYPMPRPVVDSGGLAGGGVVGSTLPVGAVVAPSGAAAPSGGGLPLFTPPADGSPWRWFKVLGSVADERYLLLETEAGFVTVDPRAAYERVLYEKLLESQQRNQMIMQPLLIPESVRLAPADAARVRKHLDVMNSLGFAVADFGNDHFIVEALPDILGDISCRELLGNIAYDFEYAGQKRGSEKWCEELIARAASRAASGGRVNFAEGEVEEVLNALAECRMPYTCPRGKPTMIFTSYRELDRKFGR